MKRTLGKLISMNQSDFIEGRQITDNILLSQELLKGYNRKNAGKRCAFKIDLQKAYDTIIAMTKVIKGESETLETLKINDVSLTCNTSLEFFHEEFNRLSNMDDDLFTYKVEIDGIANVPCDLNRDCDSEQQMSQESDNDMGGDDEVELTDEESSNSDDEEEVAGIFRIETNVFDFETPLCRTFKEFNYLLQIDPDILTKDIEGFKTYEEYKDDWIYE
ncbi:hypothetical protein Tco_0461405 [Tanacetum coccineum]